MLNETVDIIKQFAPEFRPQLAIVLGSGLGALAEHIVDPIVIDYHSLPGFHTPKVSGHQGKLYLGTLQGKAVACLKGRAHYYEGIANQTVQTMVRSLRVLGCETWLATNAAGSLHQAIGPGELVVIRDHINFQFNNPLVGPNDEQFGPRFVGLNDAYDPALRHLWFKVAEELGIKLTDGVYVATLGPSFETPAEIRAFKILGADLVGMSTVAEVIVARHCGLRVAALSSVTNYAAGMTTQQLSHEETLEGAKLAESKLIKLVLEFVRQYH